MTRGDLLKRGAVGVAAVTGAGAHGRHRCGRDVSDREVHRHAARALARGRVPDSRTSPSRPRGPRLHRQADSRPLREAAPDRHHAAGDVRRLRGLQLPVPARVAVRLPAAGRHEEDQGLEPVLQAVRVGKLNPASGRCTFGDGNAPFRTTFVDPDGSTGLPPFSGGPPNNRQIVRWIGENGKPIGGKPQPRYIVGPAATSTWTRWATTPTSSRRGPSRSPGRSS